MLRLDQRSRRSRVPARLLAAMACALVRLFLPLLLLPTLAAAQVEPEQAAGEPAGPPPATAEPATPPAAAPAAPAPAASPTQTALEERDAAQQTFLRLAEEDRYDEAVTIASQIIELTTRVFGAKSIELATPLTNLATAEMRRGNLLAAESGYKASIAVIEAAEGIGSPRLVNPLVGLAETYIRAGSYEQANEVYRRALQTNHAAEGFYNLEQIKILDGLSESYLGMDKVTEAAAQQRIQVAIQRHRTGPDSPEVVPALLKLGRWYNRTGQYPEAREAYQSGKRILRGSGSKDDAAMVDLMIGEAITYENEGAVPSSADTFKRALDLLDSRPEPDHLKRAQVLVGLGDLYTVNRQPRAARQRYAQAWQDLSADDSLLADRDRYFARPARISGPLLPTVVDANGLGLDRTDAAVGVTSKGVVVASMTVDIDGVARNPAVIESDPPGLLDKQVLRALGNTFFRPRMEDGEAVQSEGVQFRHDFRYPRAAAPGGTPPPQTPPESAGQKGGRINFPDKPDDPDSAPKP